MNKETATLLTSVRPTPFSKQKNIFTKGYVVKHNYVNYGVCDGYTRQLHVSAFTGHLQVVFQRN